MMMSRHLNCCLFKVKSMSNLNTSFSTVSILSDQQFIVKYKNVKVQHPLYSSEKHFFFPEMKRVWSYGRIITIQFLRYHKRNFRGASDNGKFTGICIYPTPLPLVGCYRSTIFKHSKAGFYGGACGVMVIVIGNEHGDTSSNPGRDWLHFT